MSIEWTTPPAAKRGRTSTKWSKVANELRERPNEWAKIGSVKSPSQASIIAKTHNIKVITRKSEDETFDIYGMFEVTNG
jgi:hypothetical protein